MSIRRAMAAAVAAFAVVMLTGCDSRPDEASKPALPAPLAGPIAAAPTPDLAPGGRIARQLWARTLSAGHTIPAHVEVVETVFGASGTVAREATRFVADEGQAPRPGQPPRYRLEYCTPVPRAGEILVNDGKSLWRYDPKAHVAARRGSASLAPMPPELEEGVASLPAQADGARPEIESQTERVAGRPTVVLALRRPVSGRMLERRWIDMKTGRTLRWEQYSGQNARLARRVEITRFDLHVAPRPLTEDAQALAVDFPKGTTVADHRSSRTQQLGDAQAAARRLRLPLHVRGFVLRGAHGDPSADGVESTHLLYGGSGGQYISVFVSPVPAASGAVSAARTIAIPMVPKASWHPVTLDARRSGFSHENREGSAVAWTDPVGEYYIAVSHLPLSHLLPVAAAFAADRDDAPSSADLSTNSSTTARTWN